MLNKLLSIKPLTPMRGYLLRGFQSDVLWPPQGLEDALNDHWRAAVDLAGGRLVEVIKVRGYRIVALLDHSEFGRCILKASCPVRLASLGFSNESIARRVQASRCTIFPEIYSITPSFVLSRFIKGESSGACFNRGLDRLALKNYFQQLKDWSVRSRGWGSERLGGSDVRQISRELIGKCLSHYRLRSYPGRLLAAFAVRKKQQCFSAAMKDLADASEVLKLPSSLMCGDMGEANIMVEAATGRFYNVDYEEMRVGHWGFDAAYFVSSILEQDPSSEKREELFRLVLTDEYLGGVAAGEYFRALTDLLIDIGHTIFLRQQGHSIVSVGKVAVARAEIDTNPSWQ